MGLDTNVPAKVRVGLAKLGIDSATAQDAIWYLVGAAQLDAILGAMMGTLEQARKGALCLN